MSAKRAAPHHPDTGPPPFVQDVLGLLAQAGEILGREGAREDHITRVTLHLIHCAADVSHLLTDEHDLDTARDALGSARSAVVAATCAVRQIQGRKVSGY